MYPMSNTKVGNELGISRQAVSKTLRSAFNKLYNFVNKEAEGPFDAAIRMAVMLNVSTSCQEDFDEFYRTFPSRIRTEIEKDAKNIINGNKTDFMPKLRTLRNTRRGC